ncbi:MAG: DUF1573 domain-containing protein [Bacteroidales bacterium]|nr:DUF1573 domain-containing protein [Bacteroidales bacterium]
MKRLLTLLLLCLLALPASAQKEFGGIARFDRTVHDFGKIDTRDGAVSCTFDVTNISESTLNIFAVTTTCGCTSAKWTRTDIAPGEKGTIDVTYTNDEGPYPFDKTLTVYLSGLERPVILHIKGTAFKGKGKK